MCKLEAPAGSSDAGQTLSFKADTTPSLNSVIALGMFSRTASAASCTLANIASILSLTSLGKSLMKPSTSFFCFSMPSFEEVGLIMSMPDTKSTTLSSMVVMPEVTIGHSIVTLALAIFFVAADVAPAKPLAAASTAVRDAFTNFPASPGSIFVKVVSVVFAASLTTLTRASVPVCMHLKAFVTAALIATVFVVFNAGEAFNVFIHSVTSVPNLAAFVLIFAYDSFKPSVSGISLLTWSVIFFIQPGICSAASLSSLLAFAVSVAAMRAALSSSVLFASCRWTSI
mmetsp:Transcript_132627/g.230512  ORF Transcript_132627/g.230512 Transcript_132627/m.230512 type:complete len:285 (-) Transcript_132627:228-1082(-)